MVKAKRRVVCKHCGKAEDEHCVFDPRTAPEYCVCDLLTWDVDKVSDACDEYEGTGKMCRKCAHDKQCHIEKEKWNNGQGKGKLTKVC